MARHGRLGMLAIVAMTTFAGSTYGQAARTKGDAAVIVEGVVRGVYRAVKKEREDAVVEVEVSRTEMGQKAAEARRLPIPAPGDQVYVHVAPKGKPPVEGSSIRIFLAPRKDGGWEGAGDDWYEALADARESRPTPRTEAQPQPEPESTPSTQAGLSGKTILKDLGLKADPVEVSGRMVLKIADLTPGTPAQLAGFEKGDVIIGVNGSGFDSLQRFADLIAKGPATAEFVALNVRNNEQATVPVDVTKLLASQAARPPVSQPSPTTPTPAAPKRSLGIDVEPVRLGLRTALKVTQVEPNGAGKKAGFEVGDILVEAGGARLGDAAQLQEAVDKAGDTLTVTVRDVRSGKDIPVEVALAASPTIPKADPSPRPEPDPSPTPTTGSATSRAIGLTVKPGTSDLLPVVKVVAVAPNSPAARAGLEVGDAIVGVNDRVVFAPDILEEALKGAGSSFTLTVLDVKSGKKSQVKVDTGR